MQYVLLSLHTYCIFTLNICNVANEQKFHVDFDFDANMQKMMNPCMPFSLLFPVTSDIDLTVCKYVPTNVNALESSNIFMPLSLRGMK